MRKRKEINEEAVRDIGDREKPSARGAWRAKHAAYVNKTEASDVAMAVAVRGIPRNSLQTRQSAQQYVEHSESTASPMFNKPVQ